MKVSVSIITASLMLTVVDSFISPHFNNHAMVKRIIDSAKYSKEDVQSTRFSSSTLSSLCNNGPFGYCNSWG